MTASEKENLKRNIADAIKVNDEVKKIVLFGSFLYSDSPNDLDIAIFENSADDYITLAIKYRRQLRGVVKNTPIDVLPLKEGCDNFFIRGINNGEVIYEKRN
jgi:predicted nucleotidyltransferase